MLDQRCDLISPGALAALTYLRPLADSGIRNLYREYAVEVRASLIDDVEVLPKGKVLGLLLPWKPGMLAGGAWDGRTRYNLLLLGENGRLSFASEDSPRPVTLEQGLLLALSALRIQGKIGLRWDDRLLLIPSEIKAYARAVADCLAVAAGWEPGSRLAQVFARAEYRRIRREVAPLLRRLDGEALHVMRLTQSGGVRDYSHYTAPEARERRIQAAKAFPMLAPLMARSKTLVDVVDTGGSLNEALGKRLGVPPATLRRFRGLTLRDVPIAAPRSEKSRPIVRLIRDLEPINPGAIPKDRSEWVSLLALRAVNEVHASITAHRDGVKPPYLQAQRKWRNLVDEILSEAGREPSDDGDESVVEELEAIFRGAGEIVRAIYRAMVLPIAVLTLSERDGIAHALAYKRIEKNPMVACRIASEMVYGKLTVPRMVRKSRVCHERPGTFRSFSRTHRWEPLFPPQTAPNGVVIQALVTSEDLSAEGADMGHCVAIYDQDCALRGVHILSLRDADGSRLSTVEIRPPAKPDAIVVTQHRGRHNMPPPPHAKWALNWLKDRVKNGAIKIEVERLQACLQERIDVECIMAAADDRNGLDAVVPAIRLWQPYLEKPWSRVPFPDFVAEVARRVAAAYPQPRRKRRSQGRKKAASVALA